MGIARWTAALMLSVCGPYVFAETGDLVAFSNRLLTYAGYQSGQVIHGRSLEEPATKCRLSIASVSLNDRLRIGEIYLQATDSAGYDTTIKISSAELPKSVAQALTGVNGSFDGKAIGYSPYQFSFTGEVATMILRYTVHADRDALDKALYLKVTRSVPWWAVGESNAAIECIFPLN